MQTLESTFLYLSMGAFFIATFVYVYLLLTKSESAGKTATGLTVLGFVTLTVTIVLRYVISGHAPFANMYEFTSSFAWGIALVYLL